MVIPAYAIINWRHSDTRTRRSDGRTVGRTDGRTLGRRNEMADGRTGGRTDGAYSFEPQYPHESLSC